jgi:hypothetical protein
MFDISAVQNIFSGLMSSLSGMLFLVISSVLGILAGLLGIGIAVHYVIKYVAGRGGASILPDDPLDPIRRNGTYNADWLKNRDKPHTWMDAVNTTGEDVTGRKHYEGDID